MPPAIAELRKVLQRSGNRCAFPECRRLLTSTGGPQSVVLGEVAHIVAESQKGPRGASELSPVDRNQYDNLLLLCNVHHQLADSQPEFYTVERLRAIKEDHELWVQRTLGNWAAECSYADVGVTELLHSNILTIDRLPRWIWSSPLETNSRVTPIYERLPEAYLAPFIKRENRLFAFQDLSSRESPFSDFVDVGKSERHAVRQFSADEDKQKWLVQLLNRTLNKITGRLGLHLDQGHGRYYFPAHSRPTKERTISYKSLTRGAATRRVVWQPRRKSTGDPRPYWLHRAVSLEFLQIEENEWCLTVRPEYRLTSDGHAGLEGTAVGRRVTRKQNRTFNYEFLKDVHFWRDYLSGSRPRIVCQFDRGQNLVISSQLVSIEVTWPGIPERFKKQLPDIDYGEDLFSVADLMQLDREA